MFMISTLFNPLYTKFHFLEAMDTLYGPFSTSAASKHPSADWKTANSARNVAPTKTEESSLYAHLILKGEK